MELLEARRIRDARGAGEPYSARIADEAAAAWLYRDRLSTIGDENPIDPDVYDFDIRAI